MIDGIPNRPLYFYQKDIVGSTTKSFFEKDLEKLDHLPFISGESPSSEVDTADFPFARNRGVGLAYNSLS